MVREDVLWQGTPVQRALTYAVHYSPDGCQGTDALQQEGGGERCCWEMGSSIQNPWALGLRIRCQR